MTALLTIRFVHLVAACVWVGGLLVLGPLVIALRRAGADRAVVQAAARQFAALSWVAMAIAVVTGLLQVHWMQISWSYGPLHHKIGVVTLTVVLAGVHHFTARQSSPAVRGVGQLAILLSSLGIVAAAVLL